MRWEYKTLVVENSAWGQGIAAEEQLAVLGKFGWELQCATPVDRFGERSRLFFKRAVPDTTTANLGAVESDSAAARLPQ